MYHYTILIMYFFVSFLPSFLLFLNFFLSSIIPLSIAYIIVLIKVHRLHNLVLSDKKLDLCNNNKSHPLVLNNLELVLVGVDPRCLILLTETVLLILVFTLCHQGSLAQPDVKHLTFKYFFHSSY